MRLVACTLSVIIVWLALAIPAAHAAGTAVEFFHAAFGHYFVTADPDEVTALDHGVVPGWSRTGYSFSVATSASISYLPVCRFFSTAFGEKSSHFYTPYASECLELKAGSTWSYESVAFYLALPTADGTCPSGSAPIYRLYNNGMGAAPNHRYTAVTAVVADIQQKGWTVEGSAVTGIFACGPQPPTGASANTTLTSSEDGVGYDMSVYVPSDYQPNSDPLPVIYALDAQSRLPALSDALHQANPRVIVVNIFDMGRHLTDYTMPGAVSYLRFLQKDVFPYIEANYRVDPRRRVISGLATSANFPFHALYLESAGKWSFAQYWMTNGSFRQQQESIDTEEQRIFEAMGQLVFPVTLVFARGATDFGPLTKELYDKMAARGYKGINLYDLAYPLGRIETDVPAFLDAITILCGKPNCRVPQH